MPKSKLRHDKVTHGNKVTAWKQRQVARQRLAVAQMYSNLPWWRKAWMKITVFTTAIKASVSQAHQQYKTMNRLSKMVSNGQKYSRVYRPQKRA